MAAQRALLQFAQYGGGGVASYRAGANLAQYGGRALRAGAHCQFHDGGRRVAVLIGQRHLVALSADTGTRRSVPT